jgi:hypothetical protein
MRYISIRDVVCDKKGRVIIPAVLKWPTSQLYTAVQTVPEGKYLECFSDIPKTANNFSLHKIRRTRDGCRFALGPLQQQADITGRLLWIALTHQEIPGVRMRAQLWREDVFNSHFNRIVKQDYDAFNRLRLYMAGFE